MQKLEGYKTYIGAAIAVALVILQHVGVTIPGVHIDDNVVILAALAATLRHGVTTTQRKQQ